MTEEVSSQKNQIASKVKELTKIKNEISTMQNTGDQCRATTVTLLQLSALEVKLTNDQITNFNKTLLTEALRVEALIEKQLEIDELYNTINHRTIVMEQKMTKVDQFAENVAANRADIAALNRAFEETSRVQGEIRLVQKNMIGISHNQVKVIQGYSRSFERTKRD